MSTSTSFSFRRLAKLYRTRLEAGKVRSIMSEAAGSPELTVVDAIDTNLDLFLHRLRYRRHHMACDFTTIDHLGVSKPRGHVLPPFGRRKPTNMRGPDTRRTLLHARASSKIVRPPMKARDALEGRINQPGLIFLGLWLLSTATPDDARPWPPLSGLARAASTHVQRGISPRVSQGGAWAPMAEIDQRCSTDQRTSTGCCALASLNAGITSFANRSSCSKATFSGTPTERLTEMRSSAGYFFSSALMCSIRLSALPHRKPPALTAPSMRGSLAVGARLESRMISNCSSVIARTKRSSPNIFMFSS